MAAKSVARAHFKMAEYDRQIWVVTPEEGTTPADVMRPDFWTHVAEQLKPWHRLEVRGFDGSWMVDLVVLAAGPLWAKVEVIGGPWDFAKISTASKVPVPETNEFEVKWRGPSLRWCVMRTSDRKPVKEELATKDEAALWLAKHLEMVNPKAA